MKALLAAEQAGRYKTTSLRIAVFMLPAMRIAAPCG